MNVQVAGVAAVAAHYLRSLCLGQRQDARRLDGEGLNFRAGVVPGGDAGAVGGAGDVRVGEARIVRVVVHVVLVERHADAVGLALPDQRRHCRVAALAGVRRDVLREARCRSPRAARRGAGRRRGRGRLRPACAGAPERRETCRPRCPARPGGSGRRETATAGWGCWAGSRPAARRRCRPAARAAGFGCRPCGHRSWPAFRQARRP